MPIFRCFLGEFIHVCEMKIMSALCNMYIMCNTALIPCLLLHSCEPKIYCCEQKNIEHLKLRFATLGDQAPESKSNNFIPLGKAHGRSF